MKSLYKFIIGAVLLVIITSVIVIGRDKQEVDVESRIYLPEVTVLEMKPGLEQEFTVTGEVFAHQISRITSELRATVYSISVKTGDSVTSGKQLISLNSSGITSSFNAASSTLQNARTGLDQTKLSVRSSIESSEIALDTTRTNLQNVLRQNRTLKKQAEEALKSAEVSLDLNVSGAEINLDNAVKNSFPVIQAAITASDKILGVSATYKHTNDDFETNLGALDRRGKDSAIRSLENVFYQLDAYSESFENALELLILTEDMLDKTHSVLGNSITGSTYTEATLTGDKISINTQISTIRSTISGLQASKSTVNSAMQSGDGGSQVLLSAKAAYEATLAQLDTSEESARNAIESAKSALENAKQSASLSELSAKSSADSAYSAYDQARISRNKLNIKAPFGGKITEVHVKTGEEVNPGTLLITVEDDSQLELIAYLSSRDVQKVNAGDVVMIGSDELSEITSISPSADPVTKKYKVEISFTSTTLRPGELVKLTFITGNGPESDRLFIPLPALHILPDELFVWKAVNRKTVKVPVTAGDIEGDFVEILSGLSVGDEIIYKGGRLIEDEGVKVKILNKPTPEIPLPDIPTS